jgi:hypothetical protein
MARNLSLAFLAYLALWHFTILVFTLETTTTTFSGSIVTMQMSYLFQTPTVLPHAKSIEQTP